MVKKKLFRKSAVLVAAALMLVGVVTVGTKVSTKASSLKLHLDGKYGKITMVNPSCEYTGKGVKPSYKVYYKSKVLKEGTDYKASYSNNVEPGTATVTVTGMGNYVGKRSAKFIVNEKPSKVKFEGEQFFAIAATGKYLIDPMANDYLTNPNQLKRLKGYSKDKIVLFDNGAHLGFVYRKEFLDDLKTTISLK